MATAGGPNIERDGLVFGYDTGTNPFSNFDHRVYSRRYFKGKPTVNFFPDGHFPDGTDMSSEAGSNAQNDIVLFKNPGDSPYVLRQTMGVASTEYQINLTTQLSANTTYVLSGWYAESTDYNASSRMFHCRAYSTGGSHTALGNGIYNVINTKIVNGITWRHCYATITTPSDYSNNFNWYVGYSSDSYSGARYYTNLKMEQGSYPTPYVAGTRSSTQSLIDLTKTTDIDVSNVSFDSTGLPTFDGTDDYIQISLTGADLDSGCTIEGVLKRNSTPSAWRTFFNIKTSGANTPFFEFRSNASSQHIYADYYNGTDYNTNTASLTTGDYGHAIATYDGNGNIKMYFNGELIHTKTSVPSFALGTSPRLTIGRAYSNDRYTDIEAPVVKIYGRALSADEVQQNYNAYKNRFNL